MKQVTILLLSALLLGLTSCKTAEEDDGEYQSPVPVTPTETETDTVSSHINVTYISASQVITIATEQWADGIISCNSESDKALVNSSVSGICLNFQMEGVTHVEVESVDGYGIAGNKDKSIVTFRADDDSTLTAGKDYNVTTFPCDLYGGYRLSIFKDGKVAHYFGVHQVTEAGKYESGQSRGQV